MRTTRHARVFVALGATLTLQLASCADALPRADASVDAPPRMLCTSGEFWNPAWAPETTMHPGRTCVSCHADDNAATGGDAPIFAVAGTVYPTVHEPDECRSADAIGTVVEVTGADGVVHRAEVNAWGNFMLETSDLALPYRARLVRDGRTRAMATPQTQADCNLCHSQQGEGGAPGRIVAP